MESFRKDGCLSDEGLHALIAGQLDELGRLEAAEHLAYCDKCTDRYTALLTADALSDPPRSVRRTVMGERNVFSISTRKRKKEKENYEKISKMV